MRKVICGICKNESTPYGEECCNQCGNKFYYGEDVKAEDIIKDMYHEIDKEGLKIGMCPKCNSLRVVSIPLNDYYKQNIQIGFLESAKIDKYICCTCGYIEEWVSDTDKFDEIYSKYKI